MSSLPLNRDEEAALKKDLLDFVHRVAAVDGEKKPEEIAILPAVAEILLWKD